MIVRQLRKLAAEPPFRLLTKALLRAASPSVQTRARWDISRRPQYLLGMFTGAELARQSGVRAISAFEFGVAGGYGLVSMQDDALAVARDTGVAIRVFGFDCGTGLPPPLADYRDHVDIWRAGDYPMDEAALRRRLRPETKLILGDVVQTVPEFFSSGNIPPIGFVSIDVDLYSSTQAALKLFVAKGSRMLNHVPMYFDDVDMVYTHRRGGELLAIDEFNLDNDSIFIDRWRGVETDRPFPEAPFLKRMYLAHHLAGITTCAAAKATRPPERLPLER
jgi:hypothetical protein